MRSLILAILAIIALSAPAFAFVQTGHLPADGQSKVARAPEHNSSQADLGTGSSSSVPSPGDTQVGTGGGEGDHGEDDDDDDDPPTRPVPEPGTMALVSMGLMALGAAARKHTRR